MMQWNKPNEGLPPIGKFVFVAMSNYFDQYNDSFVYVMKYDGNRRWEYYDGGTEYIRVLDTDRWAYIELPED